MTTSKIKMCGERHRYKVMAKNERYAVMVKPFNARKTYLYTITDLERRERGPIGLVFGLPYHVNTPERAAKLLAEMEAEGWEVSYRKSKPLTDPELEQLHALSLA